MAAKQGLSAQLSQASEDARRAVLNRTSLTSSLWFSNLNTTCTIKSAPPRTPEVLNLLSTKSGWMFKRNEQHVWQTRWCCVVPHTFLYYFDANVLPDESQPPIPSAIQQEDWNSAIANACHRKNQKGPRSSLYLFPVSAGGGSSSNNNQQPHYNQQQLGTLDEEGGDPSINTAGAAAAPPAGESFFSSSQPAGIIDLECYSAIHRSQQNQMVMELSGDDAVNPDLRSFYFCASTEAEMEDWTQALLGQRHSALMDETDAYKQVCEGFAQQLQILHSDMDEAAKQAEDSQEELYQVRSQMEEARRSCWTVVEDILERPACKAILHNHPSRTRKRLDVDTIRGQDMTLTAPIQVLADTVQTLEEAYQDILHDKERLEQSLVQVKKEQKENAVQQQLEQTLVEIQTMQVSHQQEIQGYKTQLKKREKEFQDVQKDLSSTRLEVTMYQSSTKNKMSELTNHKKILKKEVIDLRSKMEDVSSELELRKHQQTTQKLELDQEKQKVKLLERYIEKMESQVKVQQNMMEMMSQSGMGSVIHGSTAMEISVPNSPNPNNVASAVNNVIPNTPMTHDSPPSSQHSQPTTSRMIATEKPVVAAENHNGIVGSKPLLSPTRRNNDFLMQQWRSHKQGAAAVQHSPAHLPDDIDNKSHMSELTEDRTQKQFDFMEYQAKQQQKAILLHQQAQQAMRASPRVTTPPNGSGPPSFIMGTSGGNLTPSSPLMDPNSTNEQSQPKLDTIHSNAASANASYESNSQQLYQHRPFVPRSTTTNIPQHSRTGGGDDLSESTGKLSVAQRSRMQAEQQAATPVRIRMESPIRVAPKGGGGGSSQSSQKSTGGFFANIGRKLEEAIDNSVFSVEPRIRNDTNSESQVGDDDVESSSVGAQSVGSSPTPPEDSFPLTKETLDGFNREVSEEKKTTSSSLSLQERQQIQRAKQLQFLKDQGILAEKAKAGSSVSVDGLAHSDVGSSHVYPETSVSFPGTLNSSSPSQRVLRR